MTVRGNYQHGGVLACYTRSMSASLRPTTPFEFIAWEDAQATKHEFDGDSIRAMTGGTTAHAGIQRNILIALGNRLRGRVCQVFGSELKIIVAGAVRYPDALVVCSAPSPRATVADNPVVVFEILSTSSVRVDRVEKLREYQLTPSIQRYVMLEQDIAMATVFSRQKSEWIGRVRYGEDVLDMPEIDISVPMSEFYLDINLEPTPESKSPPSEEGGETSR